MCPGAGHKPALDFSFQEHNFGPCFIKQPGIVPAQAVLRLANRDTSDISFDVE